MAKDDNAAIVRKLYECFGQGDLDGVLSRMTADIQWHIPQIAGVSLSGPRRGQDSIREFFLGLAQSQEIGEMEVNHVVSQGDIVVVLGRYSRRVKPTGRRFSSEFAHAFQLSQGKVEKFQEYLDTAAVAAAYQNR